MRYLLVLFLSLSFSVISFGQSPVGEWLASEAGWKVNFKSDGTYAVDIGVDGSVDITGKYQTESGTITIQDDAGCTEKGEYKFGLENGQIWLDPISDPCTDRNPQQKVYLKKG